VNGSRKTSPATIFAASVLGVLVVVAALAVGWRVGATPDVTGDLHVAPLFGQYAGSGR
jgi:hypothetical protein